MRSRDSIREPQQLELIRAHARAALESAGAVGHLPTPVAEVMHQAKVAVADQDIFDEGFFRRMSKRAGGALRRALDKVLGVFDAKARLVYIDKAVGGAKQTFLKLHETGHAVLPWQRDLYAVVEDCEKTLGPDMSEQFDREANQFASEVLFQLDAFTEQVNDDPVGLKVPLKVGPRFGASAYASIRRYVSKHHRACAVIVLEQPQFSNGLGFVCRLRRFEASPAFASSMGELSWPEAFSPADSIGALVPVGGRRMSAPRVVPLRDTNGVVHECVAEAFDSKHHVFILVHAVRTLKSTTLVMP